MNFSTLKLNKKIEKGIAEMGYEEMTEIQAQAIPVSLQGRDVLGQAHTGTGKTLAFGIPVLEKIVNDNAKGYIHSIILAPTRELAIQIKEELELVSKYLEMGIVAVYGGEDIVRQIKLLRQKPLIVVATPGRLLDLMKRKKIRLDRVRCFVLDEVDEMLNMGFIDDVKEILVQVPEEKQTLLFSATLPEEIKKIVNKYLCEPSHIKVQSKSLTVDRVKQRYIIAKRSEKLELLKILLLLRSNENIIIFTQTKKDCDELFDEVISFGNNVTKIHGDIPQAKRIRSINEFKEGKYKILIATDVIARGIDISGVDLVINYELPQNIEYYIHRIGRTARGSKQKGEAITLVSPSVYKKEFSHYPRLLHCEIKEMQKPSSYEVKKKLMWNYYQQIDTVLKDGVEIEDEYFSISEMLMANYNEHIVVPYLLKQLYPQLAKNKKSEPKRKKHSKKRKRVEKKY